MKSAATMNSVTTLSRYGSAITTVHDLMGHHEPALTAALGWTLSQSAKLRSAVLEKLDIHKPDPDDIHVELEKAAAEHGRTDIELSAPSAHIIIEAKRGWLLPRAEQLQMYAPRFADDRESRLITLSSSSPRWAREVLPSDIQGVPVEHWSWDDVRDLSSRVRSLTRGTERLWLDQLEEYMDEATSERPVTDSLAYCVVVSDQQFGDMSFRDYVQAERVYFHPFAKRGWPHVPPNFFAFRWQNALRQLNRVVDFEVVAHVSERYPAVSLEESGSGPSAVYKLGPDIPLPNGAVPSGRNLQNSRLWILLDQLLTQPSVIEAKAATDALLA